MDQTKEVYSIRKQHNKGRQLNKRILGMNFSIFNHKSGVLFCLQNNLGLHLSEVTFQKNAARTKKLKNAAETSGKNVIERIMQGKSTI